MRIFICLSIVCMFSHFKIEVGHWLVYIPFGIYIIIAMLQDFKELGGGDKA